MIFELVAGLMFCNINTGVCEPTEGTPRSIPVEMFSYPGMALFRASTRNTSRFKTIEECTKQGNQLVDRFTKQRNKYIEDINKEELATSLEKTAKINKLVPFEYRYTCSRLE